MPTAIAVLQGGINGLTEYLSAHMLTCLVPALFIAGAISTFLSQAAILKYFGPSTKRWLSYGVASVSGAILAVCSCTVLPLFAGVYKRGAGLGPAMAFLYSGPAISILAIIYTARLLGYDLGAARAIGAIAFAVVIGIAMSTIFHRQEAERTEVTFAIDSPENTKPGWQLGIYFGLLIGILISGAQKNWIALGVLVGTLCVVLWRWFTREEVKEWLRATGSFTKLIMPWLIGCVFIAGILKVVIPETVVAGFLGGNSLRANAIASVSGALMYFQWGAYVLRYPDRGPYPEDIYGPGDGSGTCSCSASRRFGIEPAQHAGPAQYHRNKKDGGLCALDYSYGYIHWLYIRNN